MNIISEQDENEYEEITLDSKPWNPYPVYSMHIIKTALVIDSNDKIEATEKHLEDYYNTKLIATICPSSWSGKHLNNNTEPYSTAFIY